MKIVGSVTGVREFVDEDPRIKASVIAVIDSVQGDDFREENKNVDIGIHELGGLVTAFDGHMARVTHFLFLKLF
jgi:hypothetical protein